MDEYGAVSEWDGKPIKLIGQTFAWEISASGHHRYPLKIRWSAIAEDGPVWFEFVIDRRGMFTMIRKMLKAWLRFG